MNWAYILSAASLALCSFFFLYFRRYIKRRTAAEELLAEYRTEVYRLIAEIDAATDRDALLVEDRIKTLKQTMEDTDRRIAVYTRELERSRSGEALYTSLGRGIRAAIDPEARNAHAPLTGAAALPASAAGPSSGPPEAVPAGETPPSSIPPAAANSVAESPKVQAPLKQHIAALAAEGLSPGDIASRLNLSLSEVDLALNLLGRGFSPS